MRGRSFLIAALLASACGTEGEPREWRPSDHQHAAASDSSQQDPDQGGGAQTMQEAVASLFRARCGPCHGEDGRGGGHATAGMNVPDLSSATLQDSRTDEELAAVIRDGRGMMPGFSDDLNERGIEVLVGHVRSLRQE